MHSTVKKFRDAVRHIDGSWVSGWTDGSILVGCSRPGFDIGALKSAVEHAGFSAEIDEDNRLLKIIEQEEIDMSASMEMPKYQSHQRVWALKIAAIEFSEDGSTKITQADKRYGTIETDSSYKLKYRGCEEDLGYYVVYADGSTSWSPTKAFEEGYTLIG